MEKFVKLVVKIHGLIYIALHSLYDHKLRSGLSALGIICGVMAVLTMISIGEGAKQDLLLQIEQLGTKNIYLNKRLMTDAQKKKQAQNFLQDLYLVMRRG